MTAKRMKPVQAMTTRLLPISSLKRWKNDRSADNVVEAITESFGHSPQLQNIVVRELGNSETFEIICGVGRFEAARKLGWSVVEAKVVVADDRTAEVYRLEENLLRKALPDETKALARLVALREITNPTQRGGDRKSKAFRSNGHGGSENSAAATVARATGRSVRSVRRAARVGRLGIPALQQAVAQKTVTINEAGKIAGLPHPEQERQLTAVSKNKHSSKPVRDAGNACRALAYAEKLLRRCKFGDLGSDTLNELRARANSVAEAVELLGRSKGSISVRPVIAAKTAILTATAKDVRATACFTPVSHNTKLSPVVFTPKFAAKFPFVASTSVGIQATCSDRCPYKGGTGAPGGCLAEAGRTKLKIQRLDAASEGFSATEIIAEEARQIDASFGGGRIPQDGKTGGRDLRLHYAGDVGSSESARQLGEAARGWKRRGGGAIWTYTHGWRSVPRANWGNDISVLASIENVADIERARQEGYAAAITVEKFPNGGKAFQLPGSDAKLIPCPAETRATTCAQCRLCFSDGARLKSNTVIAFELHGQRVKEARESLREANGAVVKDGD